MKTKVAIIGSAGLLGSTLCSEWQDSCDLLPIQRADLDLRDGQAVASFLDTLSTDWLFYCAGMTSLEGCENNPSLADLLNHQVPAQLARGCEKKQIRLVHFSTDYVFDGNATSPYCEEDAAAPLGTYGTTKLAGEIAVLKSRQNAFVFRVSWLFGPGRTTFPNQMLQRALNGSPLEAVCDKWASPTSTLDLAKWLHPATLADRGTYGLFHACNAGECTWLEYAQTAVDCAADLGIPIRSRSVTPVNLASLPALSAPRPVYSVLDTSKLAWHFGFTPRSWQSALKEYLHDFTPR